MTRAQVAHLKKAFLEQFAEYGNITTAARVAGVARRTIYGWQEQDDEFAAAFREAEITATEVLESEARRRAVEGVVTITPNYHRGALLSETIETKYSDTLLIFLLKARAPDKYRERTAIEHSGPGGGAIQTEDVSLSDDDRAARILALIQRAGERATRSLAAAEPDMDTTTGPTDGSMAV
jgi:hypothetical protein